MATQKVVWLMPQPRPVPHFARWTRACSECGVEFFSLLASARCEGCEDHLVPSERYDED